MVFDSASAWIYVHLHTILGVAVFGMSVTLFKER